MLTVSLNIFLGIVGIYAALKLGYGLGQGRAGLFEATEKTPGSEIKPT